MAIDVFDEVSGMLYNVERYSLTASLMGNFWHINAPENATLAISLML